MSHYVFLMKGVYFMEKKTLYFLCTGNSCRSQMAEGFAKKYLSDWNIKSAGIEAHGLNPMAVKAMAEVGNKKIVAVNSLESLAGNEEGKEVICSMIDARNNQVYMGLFDCLFFLFLLLILVSFPHNIVLTFRFLLLYHY